MSKLTKIYQNIQEKGNGTLRRLLEKMEMMSLPRSGEMSTDRFMHSPFNGLDKEDSIVSFIYEYGEMMYSGHRLEQLLSDLNAVIESARSETQKKEETEAKLHWVECRLRGVEQQLENRMKQIQKLQE